MDAHIISTVFLTSLALAFFFYIGYRVKDTVTSADDFLFSGRNLESKNLAYTWSVSTVAYASGILYYMQVIPLWGYWVFVGSIGFYAIGQVAALYIATRPHIDFSSFSNLGGLIAQEASSQAVGWLISIFNLLAAIALIYIEIGLGVELFGFLFPGSASAFKLTMAVVLSLVVFLYLSFGGFTAVVESDRWQTWLVIAAGISIVVVSFFLAVSNTENGRPVADFSPNVPLSPDILIYLAFAFAVNAVFNVGQLSIWQRVAATKSLRDRVVGGSIGIGSSTILYTAFIVAAGIYVAAGYSIAEPADIFRPVLELGPLGAQLLFPVLFVGLVAALISSADTAAMTATLAVFGGREPSGGWMRQRRIFLAFIGGILATVVGSYAAVEYLGSGYQATFLAIIFYMYSQLVVASPVIVTAILFKCRLRNPRMLVGGLISSWAVLTTGTFSTVFGSGLTGNLTATLVALALTTMCTVRLRPSEAS